MPKPTLSEQLRELASTEAKAGAPPVRTAPNDRNRRDESEGKEQGERSPEVSPPIWQKRPKEKVEVTADDLANFKHFWLVNVRYKLLVVAIPKVTEKYYFRKYARPLFARPAKCLTEATA